MTERDSLYSDLGRNIKAARVELRLSQRELAEMVEESSITISRWETGTRKPQLEDLMKLSRIFNCTVSRLLQGPTQNNSLLVDLAEKASLLPDREIDELIAIANHKLTKISNKAP